MVGPKSRSTDVDPPEQVEQWLQVCTRELAHEHANLQAIFDAAPVGMLLLDGKGEITRANHAAAQLVDTEVGKLWGRQPGDGLSCVHARDVPQGCGHSEVCPTCPIRCVVLHVLQTGEEVRDVEAARRLDVSGEERDFHLSLTASPLELNGQRHVLLAISDITHRKQMEQEIRRSHQLLSVVLKSASEISIIATDPDGRIVVFNRGAERMLGYSSDEIIGKQTPAAFHLESEVDLRSKELTEELGCTIEGFRAFVAKPEIKGSEQREWTYVKKDGSPIQVSLVVTAMRSPTGEIIGYLGIAQDITERKRAALQLEESRERLDLVLKGTNVGLWDWNVQTGETVFNERWAEIVGYSLEELSPVSIETWLHLAHPDDLKKSNELLEMHFVGDADAYDFEARMKHKNGTWIWVHDRGKVVTWDSEGRPLRMTGTHTDITERKRAEERLREMSERDPLTDLLNRRAFRERLTLEWERAARYQHPVSCVMLDLDFFKRVNDIHGHVTGDATLEAIAGLLEDHRRSSDALCRYGGEEFCLLLPETNEAEAIAWAERVRLAISQAVIPTGKVMLHVTASFGVAERKSNTSGPEDLVRLADDALAVAKQSGRNRVVGFAALRESMSEWSQVPGSAGPPDDVVARDVMSAIASCPHQRDCVRQVADLFLQTRVNSAPVVNDAGTVAGIVTEDDLMAQTAFGKGWDDSLQDVMSTDVVCYEGNTPLRDVCEFLSRTSVPHVVVVDQGRPIGVISRATLLRWFRNWGSGCGEETANDGRGGLPEERECRQTEIVKTAPTAGPRAVPLPLTLAGDDQDFVSGLEGEATGSAGTGP